MSGDFFSFIRKNEMLIKYGIIGVICAGTDFVIYTFLTLRLNISYLYANIISVNVGILSSFFLNRHFTFKVKNKPFTRLLIFYLVGLTGLVVSSLLLYIFVDALQWNKVISKVITILVVALLQFLLNKFVTFSTSEKR